MRYDFILLVIFFLLSLSGCREEEDTVASPPAAEPIPAMKDATVEQQPPVPAEPGCRGCHTDVIMDGRHDFACTDCHSGNNETDQKDLAHQGMVARAADPAHMETTCGRCHPEQTSGCAHSSHFTLKNAVNLVRRHFGIEPLLNGVTEIPDHANPPEDKEQLVNDLLRRRCLRCHVYSKGDSYPHVRRGTGCAVCHLQYTDGRLHGQPENHAFIRPEERQCLSCHYGNHVGSDFVGYYEHDHDWSYRTPHVTRKDFLRPYGIEQHNLVPDIHQQAGMTCLDCHSGAELAGKKPSVQCVDCHSPEQDAQSVRENIRLQGEDVFLQLRNQEKKILIPQLQHPAHAKYMNQVACQVCHAQWAFNDQAVHLLLSYSEDADPWQRLSVQSSSEVENFVEHNLYSDKDEREPTMPDQVSGKRKPGIWYAGFTTRRWEDLLIHKDRDDIIKVFRPILDLRLSAADEDGEVIADFDNLTGHSDGLLPYTPHTTGPAGIFYEQRFLRLLTAQPDHAEEQ
ncbi:MAG: hypothetical protein ACL93V_10005 [Candidatus Electrothrix sp. YB6]